MKKFAEEFKGDMEKIHAERYKSDIEKGLKSKLEVVCNPVYAASKRNPANNDTASKVKADGDSGFEESVKPVPSKTRTTADHVDTDKIGSSAWTNFLN